MPMLGARAATTLSLSAAGSAAVACARLAQPSRSAPRGRLDIASILARYARRAAALRSRIRPVTSTTACFIATDGGRWKTAPCGPLLQDHRDPVRLGRRDGPLRDLRDLDRHPRQRDTPLLERLADEIRALLGKAELRHLGGRDDVDLAVLLLGRLGDGADLCELFLGKVRRR